MDDFEAKIDENEIGDLSIIKDGETDDAVVDEVDVDEEEEEKEADTGMFGDDPAFEEYLMTGEYAD